MKSLVVFVLLLGAVASVSAQVSSHAPAGAAKPATTTAARPSVSPFQISDRPAARVNGSVLTDRDLLREMLQIFPYASQHNGFPKEQEASIRQGALQMIIFEELVYQEALRRKLIVPGQVLKQSEADLKKQFKSSDEYRQYLASEMGGSEQLVRDKIKRSLLIEQVLKTDVQNKSVVSVSEARVFYEKNSARFQVAESYAFQSISVLPPQNPSADAKKEMLKRANDALQQAKKTTSAEDFGLLAERISEDDFRVNMGNHKDVAKDKLPPEVVKVLLTMKPGQVSGVIQIQQAYTIIRLNAHTMAKKQNFEEVKSGLRTELQKSKYEQLRAGLDRRLRANANVEVM
jgi:parvulin-like peptidyl-prolyl isomerase